MKASLVSATSVAALLVFEVTPAGAAVQFSDTSPLYFQDALVNCSLLGPSASPYCSPVSMNETVTNVTNPSGPVSFTFGSPSTVVFTGGAPSNTITLAGSGSTATQAYTFAPTIMGLTAATVSVKQVGVSNAQTSTVALEGTGVAPVQSTSSTNNGYVLVGSGNNTATVTVTNTGNGNLAQYWTGSSFASVPTSVSNLTGSVSATTGTGYSGSAGSISLGGSGGTNTQSTQFSYTFAPTVKGQTSSATVTLNFSDGNANKQNTAQTVNVTLTGTGVAPVQSTSSGSLSNPVASGGNPYVLVGSTQSAVATVTVTNTGNGNLAGADSPTLQSNLHGSVSVSGNGFGVSGSNTVNLYGSGGANTQSQTYTYYFQPTVTGASTGTGLVTFTNGNSAGTNAADSASFTYTGTGVAPVASMRGGSGGYVLVGNSTAVTATVQNTGNGNLSGAGTVSNLQGSVGALNGIFSGSSVALGGGSGLGDSTSQTLNYTFTPTGIGTYSTSVTASFTNGANAQNSGGTLDATLNGTGVAPQASVTVSNAGYVLVNSGANTGTATVTVNNNGNGNLAGADSPSLQSNLHGTQGSASSSVFTGGGSINLTDTSGTTFTYNFAPTARGAVTATATSSFTNGIGAINQAGAITSTLTGTGVAPIANVSVTNPGGVGGSANTGNLGYLLVGSQTAAATVTQSNTGDGNLAGTGGAFNLNGSITNVQGGGYSGGTTGSSISLLDSHAATGATTGSVTYTFAPTARGASTTVVTSSFSNGSADGYNNATTVNTTLTGTGVAPVASIASSGNTGYVLVKGSNTTSVTVQNTGDGNLAGTGGAFNLNGSVSASNGSGFSGGSGSFSLQDANAGATTSTYAYTFAPTARGASSSVVTGTFNNGIGNTNTSGNLSVTLAGTGVAPIASVAVTNAAGAGGGANTGNLGYVLVNSAQSATATVTQSNQGDGNLAGTGGAYNLNGSITNVQAGGYSGGTSGASISLLDSHAATGATTSSYAYTFAPTVVGSATTVVTSAFTNGSTDGYNNATTVNTTLTGTGVAPIESVTSSSGLLARVGTTATATVTVTNTGNGNLSGLGAISNLNAGSIGLQSGTPFTSAGGNATSLSLVDAGSSTLSYVYNPISRGSSAATVTIGFNNGDSTGQNLSQTVQTTITGAGVGPAYQSQVNTIGNPGSFAINTPVANTGTSDVSFGTGHLPSKGALTETLTLQLSNTTLDPNGGDATLTDLTIESMTITGGSDPSAFSIANFGTVIPEAGGPIDLTITLTASTVGFLTGFLTIQTDEGAAYGAIGDTFNYELMANVQGVPEPESLALFGFGLAGLGWARRRQRKQ